MCDTCKANGHVKYTYHGNFYIAVFTYLSYRADKLTCPSHVKIHANFFTVYISPELQLIYP